MDDAEYLPLSLLSQVTYCPRRAALLMNERVWVESADTARGRAEHERVHTNRVERRGDSIKLYEYSVFSDNLLINGKCDCVEAEFDAEGCMIPASDFPVRLYPVEYKHGKVREEIEYEIQLCAQAMCLEEMFGAKICEGALFYISSHRRHAVAFDGKLRSAVCEAAEKLRELRDALSIPAAVPGAKCKRCSIRELCMPDVKRSAEQYCGELEREAKGDMII